MSFDQEGGCWRPSVPYGIKSEPRLNVAQFGDGYQQRIIDGLNATKRTWSLQFNGRHVDILNAMDDYLTNMKGSQFPFYDPVSQRVFQVFCDDWSINWGMRKPDGEWIGSLTADFYSAYGTVVTP